MNSAQTSVQNKQAWKDFFNHEKELHQYLREQTCLNSTEDGPDYIEYLNHSLTVFERPPRWIRWIGQLTEDSSTYLQLSEKLNELYRIAVGDNFKRYPTRFPVFYENVEQINISINDAYESFAVKKNVPLTLKQVFLYKNDEYLNRTKTDEIHRDAMQLNEIGIPATVKEGLTFTPQGSALQSLVLKVNTEALLKYANCAAIQCRRYSGKQYRARLRERGQSAGKRIKFGLIVIDKDSEVSVVESTPQARRPHSLREKGDVIELPIDTNIALYRN